PGPLVRPGDPPRRPAEGAGCRARLPALLLPPRRVDAAAHHQRRRAALQLLPRRHRLGRRRLWLEPAHRTQVRGPGSEVTGPGPDFAPRTPDFGLQLALLAVMALCLCLAGAAPLRWFVGSGMGMAGGLGLLLLVASV